MNERLFGMEEEVFAQLDRTWKNLREIAEGAGHTLSGSGWENCADRLVEKGMAETKLEIGAPMGKVYRTAL